MTTVYLEVEVAGETLSPRTQMLSAAYALNADALDGRNSGNASGNIPISNGTVNTNLNADLLDGLTSADFAPASGSSSYVQLAPAAAQTWTTANTGIFLSETGAGSPFLMRLQTGGSDMLVLGNTGNMSLNGDLQVMGNDLQDNSGNARLTLGTTVTTPAGTHFSVTGNTTLGDAGADTLTFNANTLAIPNNLNVDADTLFVDATNNRVGIGTASPGASLHMLGRALFNSSGATTGSDGIVLSVVKPSGASNAPALELLSYASDGPGAIIGSQAGGSQAAPSASAVNNQFLSLRGYGHDGSAYACGANIIMRTPGVWTTASHPTQIEFLTTAAGTTTVTERMRIDSAGNVGVGTASPATALHVSPATGLTLGLDAATNTAGKITLIGAGANDFYTVLQTATQTANVTYTLPTAGGSAGQLLSTDAGGNMSWTGNVPGSDTDYIWNQTAGAQNASFWLDGSGTARFGANPSQSGAIRMSNNTWITARNAANSADLNMIEVSSGNNVRLGTSSIEIPTANLVTLTTTNPAAPRTYTIPDAGANDDFVFRTASQTLTNKTLSTSCTWNGNTIGAAYGGTGQNSSAWTGLVKVSGGTWSTATGGTDYENPLTFTNGLTRTSNDVHLGGALEGATTITNGTASNLVINLSSTGDFDIQDNGTSALFVRDDGNVGIGQSNPSQKLVVNGNIRIEGSNNIYKDGSQALGLYDGTNLTLSLSSGGNFVYYPFKMMSGGSAAATMYTFNGDDNTGMFSPGADSLAFSTAGTSRLHIASDGSVGIATTAPSASLSIAESVGLGTVSNGTYAGFANAGLIFKSASGGPILQSPGAFITYALQGQYGADIQFVTRPEAGTNAQEIMRIASAGNVGVGVTSPTTKIDTVGGLRLRQSGGGNPAASLIELGNRSTTWTYGVNFNAYYDGTWKYRSTDYAASIGFDNVGSLCFDTMASGTAGNALTFSRKMTILNDGKVGIGTASPTNRLHVEGTGGGSAGIYLNSAVPSSTASTLYNNGGTLYWNGSAVGGGSLTSDGNGTATRVAFWSTSNTVLGGSANLYWDNGFNRLGIGTASPATALEVSGTVRATKWEDSGNPAACYMDLDSAGIALQTPSGNIIGGTISAANGSAGTPAFNFYNAGGDSNTGIFRPAEDTMAFSVGGSEKVRLNSSGQLGIGTTGPGYPLDIKYGDVNDAAIRIGNTANSVTMGLWFGIASQFYIQRGSGNHFLIDASGNVGMGGVYSPGAVLDVKTLDASGAAIALRVSKGDSTTHTPLFHVLKTGDVGIGTASPAVRLDVVGGNVTIDNNKVYAGRRNSDSLMIGMMKIDTSDFIEIGPLWSQVPAGIKFSINGSEKMRMDSSGNFGIGTAGPGVRLDVAGGAIRTDNQLISTLATGTAPLAVSSTTVVTNLNADYLDGQHGSYYTPASWVGGDSVKSVGNFGQWANHATYTDFNANLTRWGWNFVQGTTNAPNATSSQWYRFVGSLGADYPNLQGAGAYRLELAIPRFNHASAGVWMRTMENGAIGGWTQIAGGGSSDWTDAGDYLTPADGGGVCIYETGASAGNITGVNKLDAVRVDPPVLIDGKQYSTWCWEGIGLRTDVVGVGELRDGVFTIDLSGQPEKSDLWLFWNVVAADTIVPFVTPQDEAYLMARMEGSVLTVKAVSGVKNARFSYRLSAKRIDMAGPSEKVNVRDHDASAYVDVSKFDKNGVPKDPGHEDVRATMENTMTPR
ncbi:MAG: hypothetical protein RDV41_08195 [Planctomycetota bacterium]|nr:hypothetical protein [Planctomycetota bacterium]